MRTHKKLAALLLVLIFSLSLVTMPYAQTDLSAITDPNLIAEAMGEEFAENYFRATELFNNFYDSLLQSRIGDIIYPDNFGGIYINDYGNLVVLVVGSAGTRANTSFIEAYVDSSVAIREVAFAYNDLWHTFRFLQNEMISNRECSAIANVTGIWLDVIGNQVYITLDDYSDEHVANIGNMVEDSHILAFMHVPRIRTGDEYISHSPPIEYSHAKDISLEDYAISPFTPGVIRPGDCIYLRHPTNSNAFTRVGTVGYRAQADVPGAGNQHGFVTAAHIGWNVFGRYLRAGDNLYDSSRRLVGTVTASQRSSIDAAFVRQAPGALVTDVVHYGRIMPQRYRSTALGTVVITDTTRNGRTGRAGVIRGHWFGEDAHGFQVSGVRATFAVQPGDSGAIVYTWHRSGDNGVQGIVIASWPTSSWPDGGNALYSLALNHIMMFPGDNPRPR